LMMAFPDELKPLVITSYQFSQGGTKTMKIEDEKGNDVKGILGSIKDSNP